MVKKTIVPTDFRDFLSIISIVGFLAIFFEFSLSKSFLSDIQTPLFLIIAGAGLMFIGKILTINKWLKDGLQSSEFSMVFAGTFGLASMIIGLLMLFGVNLPSNITGLIGFIALGPTLFIFLDYLSKNR